MTHQKPPIPHRTLDPGKDFAAHIDLASQTVSLTPASPPFRFTSREQLEAWLRLNTCLEVSPCA